MCISSLSKNKSSGSARLGGSEPEAIQGTQTCGMQQMQSDTRVQNQLQVSDARLKNLHKITACVHADVYVFCGCPGFDQHIERFAYCDPHAETYV